MKNIYIYIFLLLPAFVTPKNTMAQPDTIDKKSMNLIAENDCENLTPLFNKVKSWVVAHKGTKPETPTPPVIDLDCHACSDGEDYEDKNQSLIDSFNAKSSEPEAGMIKIILSIAKAKILLGEGGNIFADDHYPNNGKHPCLDKMNDGDLRSFLESLSNRLRNKATQMVTKYKNSPQYYYGGCSFYLGVMRQLALLGFSYRDIGGDPDFLQWAKNNYNKYQERLLKQYQYQLYLGTCFLPREMAMLGFELDARKLVKNNDSYSIEHVDEGVQLVNKAITFMHFKLKMEIKANGHGENGAQLSCILNGEEEIRCDVKGGRCYEWKGENGDMIKFVVRELIFENPSGILVYQGPKEFINPFALSIGLCDDDPQFTLQIQEFGPPEENYKVSKPGGAAEDMQLNDIISTLFAGIMADQSIERYKKMENRKAELQALETELEGIAQRHEAHKNDPAYGKTEQGIKDRKRWQQLQKQFGMTNGQMPDAKTEMTKIIAPFKIGDSKPVDFTVKAKLVTSHNGGAGWDYATLKVTLEEMPDTKDNIK